MTNRDHGTNCHHCLNEVLWSRTTTTTKAQAAQGKPDADHVALLRRFCRELTGERRLRAMHLIDIYEATGLSLDDE